MYKPKMVNGQAVFRFPGEWLIPREERNARYAEFTELLRQKPGMDAFTPPSRRRDPAAPAITELDYEIRYTRITSYNTGLLRLLVGAKAEALQGMLDAVRAAGFLDSKEARERYARALAHNTSWGAFMANDPLYVWVEVERAKLSVQYRAEALDKISVEAEFFPHEDYGWFTESIQEGWREYKRGERPLRVTVQILDQAVEDCFAKTRQAYLTTSRKGNAVWPEELQPGEEVEHPKRGMWPYPAEGGDTQTNESGKGSTNPFALE